MITVCKSEIVAQYFNFDEYKTLYTKTKEDAINLISNWNKLGVKLDIAYVLENSKIVQEHENNAWNTDISTGIQFYICNLKRKEVYI